MDSTKLQILVFLIISAAFKHFVFCSYQLAGDGLTDDQIEKILDEINTLRSNLQPTAANGRKIIYSNTRGMEAKVFTDKCEIPNREEPSQYRETFFFSWTSKTPDNRISILRPFRTKYDYDKDSCEPSAKNCEFYKNLVSDQVFYIGCSRNSACQKNFTEITICVTEFRMHRPLPYVAGPPCSQCYKQRGAFCYKNLCTNEEDCRTRNCTCETKCKNCGVLDKTTCTCQCRSGYDRVDCSQTCRDYYINCDKITAFRYIKHKNDSITYYVETGKGICRTNFITRFSWCRKWCGSCQSAKPYALNDTSTHPCCPGVVCPNGKMANVQCQCENKFGFTDAELNSFLDVPNQWRSDVQPPARNLQRLELESNNAMAEESKVFTDDCKRPAINNKDRFSDYFYISWTTNYVDNSTTFLKRFYKNYSFSSDFCEHSTYVECEEFRTFIADTAYKVGCSRNSYCDRLGFNFTEITVCLVLARSPQVDLKPLYIPGKPCTACNQNLGTFCHKRLCISKERCRKEKLNCTCERRCKNCSKPDDANCACHCLYGYYGQQCDDSCLDWKDCRRKYAYWTDSNLKWQAKAGQGCEKDIKYTTRFCPRYCKKCRDALPKQDPEQPLSLHCCYGNVSSICTNDEELNRDCLCENKFGFTDAEWKGLLDACNEWRSEVRPTATNMNRLEMSTKLAEEAKFYADNCDAPPIHVPSRLADYAYVTIKSKDMDNTTHPLSSLYKKYDLATDSCANSTKEECEIFKAFIADTAVEIGCSRKSDCESLGDDFAEITVCVIGRRSDLKPLYVPGKPCTNCVQEYGTFCHKNLCVSKEICRKEKLTCTCERRCANCSKADDANCTCECLYGYDGQQCDDSCRDRVQNCPNLAGFGFDANGKSVEKKGLEACGIDVKFAGRKCRKFCGKCREAFNKPEPLHPLSRKCCPDLVCPSKKIPDFYFCTCEDAPEIKFVEQDDPENSIDNYPEDGCCKEEVNGAEYVSFPPLFQFVTTVVSIFIYFVLF